MKTNLKLIIIAVMSTSLMVGSCGKKSKEKKNLDVSLIETSIDPGNNFYKFVNTGWEKAHPLPADESRFGSFDLLAKETKKKVKIILEEAAEGNFEQGSIEQKIGDFYMLGMDTEKINKEGISPIKPELERIESIKTIEDIQKQITHFHSNGIGSLFSLGAGSDAKNSEMIIAQLGQGGLGMSDRDYYVNDDNRSKEIREAYVDYIIKIFKLSGIDGDKAEESAHTIMNIETRLAKASMTRLERRDPHKTYNKLPIKKVKQNYPNFDWVIYFNGLNIEEPEEINVRQTEFLNEMNEMLTDVPVNDWKTYFKWNLLNSSASYLSDDFVQTRFDFYGKAMQGKEQMMERWRRILDVTNYALGQAIGKKFVEKHFPPEAKERMETLVENLRTAFAQRIDELEWMSLETKEKAHEKLKIINKKIGYPDEWRDYSELQIEKTSYIANVFNARKFNKQYQLNKIGKPVDRNEWFFPPQTVNAYYAPSLNEICFPAGILQPPFFYLDGDDAVNYGAIGAVIGHEMTHGFDDQGRLYDKEGNLNNWWTEEDSKKFDDRTKILVKQYDNKIVLDTMHADGELTLGENIADLGGLSIAHTAFLNATKDKDLPEKIDGYTPEQRFYLAWARVWAQNIRDEEIQRRTKEDVHSLGIHRVNGPVVNMENWYKAFNVTEENEMYLPENKWAKIW